MCVSHGSSRRSASCKGARLITSRDRSVIALVALHGAASRKQLMELGHFTSVSRANRRLRLLCQSKFLRPTFIAIGPRQSETIYVLGPAGSTIAAEDCDLDLFELKRHSRRDPQRMYLEHHLGVLDVRLQAERLQGSMRLAKFLPNRNAVMNMRSIAVGVCSDAS